MQSHWKTAAVSIETNSRKMFLGFLNTVFLFKRQSVTLFNMVVFQAVGLVKP